VELLKLAPFYSVPGIMDLKRLPEKQAAFGFIAF